MFVRRVVLLLLLCATGVVSEPQHQFTLRPTKRVAVIGMGTGGINSLKALVGLPRHMRDGWDIVAYEQRDGVGGLWIPQDHPPSPPEIPDTPLYPSLRTNGPHPSRRAIVSDPTVNRSSLFSVSLPHRPFPPETPLLAPRAAVLKYHQDTVSEFNLSSYVKLQHIVHEAKWVGSSTEGYWNVVVEDRKAAQNFTRSFDHLIVASGVNRFPRWVTWSGMDDWLASGKTITHSIYYRDPNVYSNRSVVVVGGGPSGWDLTRVISGRARKVYWSRDRKAARNVDVAFLPDIPGTVDIPRIASLAGGIVHLTDDTELDDVDVLILATGYEIHMPFLTAGGFLDEIEPGQPQSMDRMTTNTYYMHPLYEHTVALDSRYPVGSLYFNGIIIYNPTGMTDTAQALFAAYTIARPELLRSREELLVALEEREARVRAEAGIDPTHYGHKVSKGYGPLFGHYADGAHEDLLVHYLRDNGLAGQPGVPSLGVNFTEHWRVFALEHGLDLVSAWYAGLAQGGEHWEETLMHGRRTEQDYVDLMHEVVNWWLHRQSQN